MSKGLFLRAGRPTERTAKEQAIAAVQDTSDEAPAQPVAAPLTTQQAAKPKKVQRFNVDLPDDLHRAMKARAASEGVKLNALTIRLFEEYLGKTSNG